MAYKTIQAFNGLDVRTMRIFIAAADAGNLTYAASINHVALGAASRRISNFESLIGKPLLKRHARGVKLTETGRVVADSVRRILGELNSLGNLSHNALHNGNKVIRLVANCVSMIEYLPEIIGKFKENNPDIEIELQESRSWESEQALRQDYARIAIAAETQKKITIDGFETFEYHNQSCVLVTYPSHPLGNKKSVKLSETLDYDFIGLPPSSIIFNGLKKEARKYGKVMRTPIEVISNFHACQMVSTGAGITVCPRIVAEKLKKAFNLKVIKLECELKPFKTMIIHAPETAMNESEIKLLHFLRKKKPSIKTVKT